MSFFSNKSEPLLLNNYNRIKPLIHSIPQLNELNLSQVLNSEVVCRVCRGKRVHYVRNQEVNTLKISHCLHCNGSGVMTNRE